ncbi:hypothetical protein ACQUQU_02010 [Thalassolituus sp. LLYu03]|uniref:hypothetical protein n=1 Tax=Thalassolituus sp. LLYu03 TaxID=3421656 RepID=UPI003D26DBF8
MAAELRLWSFLLCAGLGSVVFAADPTMPPDWQRAPVSAAAAEPELRLQQIRISAGDALAVINDRIVRVGDQIDGAQVMAISPSSVRVKIRQNLRELSLLTITRRVSE